MQTQVIRIWALWAETKDVYIFFNFRSGKKLCSHQIIIIFQFHDFHRSLHG